MQPLLVTYRETPSSTLGLYIDCIRLCALPRAQGDFSVDVSCRAAHNSKALKASDLLISIVIWLTPSMGPWSTLVSEKRQPSDKLVGLKY